MSTHSLKINQSVRPSIMDTLEKVMVQVEYQAFASLKWKWIDPLYYEMCLIISEVLVIDPESTFKLNGETINAHLVQEVFTHLRHDHLRLVFENLNNGSYQVYNKKAYLRTALYNAFFEIESHYGNLGHFS